MHKKMISIILSAMMIVTFVPTTFVVAGSVTGEMGVVTISDDKNHVTSISFNKTALEVEAGTTASLTATITVADSKTSTTDILTWSSSNSKVKISGNGNTVSITVPDDATDATITLTAKDESGNITATKSISLVVKSKEKETVEDKDMDKDKDSKSSGDKTTTISDIANCSIQLQYSKMTYNGSARTMNIVVTNAQGIKLVKGTDYKLQYNNNTDIGTASVTIIGLNKYAGSSISKTFKIIPKKVTIKNPTVGTKSVTVKWKKLDIATGYQVYVCTNKAFDSGVKKATVTGAKTLKKVVKSLKKGKKYYVKVRAYKTVDGTKYYGKWSNVKRTAKVK